MKYIAIFIISAAFFFPYSAGAMSVLEKYAFGEQIHILIVPGHDKEYGGAVFKGRDEAVMTLPLAKKMQDLINTNPRFSATVARIEEGYIPELATYFKNTDEITQFIEEHTEETVVAIENGRIDVLEGVAHNDAPSLVVTRLYGINKWAPENGYDIVLHIHFNDVYPRMFDQEGEATGFSIYTPGPSLQNYRFSKVFADTLGERMKRSIFISDLPIEAQFADQSGVIEEQKLIAIGAKGTLDIPSILVEYSYIYEPMLQGDFFSLTTDVMARSAVYGITEYFSGIPLSNKNLAYEWKSTLKKTSGSVKQSDVLALQFALHELGLYPQTQGREKCPMDGMFGPCTETAVKDFQKAYGLEADGILGPKSLLKLNSFFP